MNTEQQKEFDRIVNEEYLSLVKDTKADKQLYDEFMSLPKEEYPLLHMNWGMRIRNIYNLWKDSILTRNWLEHPESHEIEDGIDVSKDHPDQVSMDIIEIVIERFKTENK